jgi:5-methylcytosine-specific restriction endonuclease McrBC regulatory subunit McrC
MDHHKKYTFVERVKSRCRTFLKKEIEEAKDNAVGYSILFDMEIIFIN